MTANASPETCVSAVNTICSEGVVICCDVCRKLTQTILSFTPQKSAPAKICKAAGQAANADSGTPCLQIQSGAEAMAAHRTATDSVDSAKHAQQPATQDGSGIDSSTRPSTQAYLSASAPCVSDANTPGSSPSLNGSSGFQPMPASWAEVESAILGRLKPFVPSATNPGVEAIKGFFYQMLAALLRLAYTGPSRTTEPGMR